MCVSMCACVGVVVRRLTAQICLLQISSHITECDYDIEEDEEHKGRSTMCCITHNNNQLTLFFISARER